MYADVIIDISLEKLDRPFGYHIPDRLLDTLETGMCVTVPFGKGNTPRKGYVVAITERSSCDPALAKDILGIERGVASVEERSIAIAAFLRKNYGGTMNQALHVVLPAKVKVKALEHKTIHRLMNREELTALLGEAGRKHQVAKARLLEAVLAQDTIPYEWVTGKLGVSGQTVLSLVKAGAIRMEVATGYRNPVKMTAEAVKRNVLSSQQQHIVDVVTEDVKSGHPGTYLIHGITGSGKTEVYMRLIEETIQRGQQTIFLIPEIALTYQTLMRFYSRFGDRVSVMNSTLSPGEKYDQCERAKNGEIDVIIGPRSALFTPFPNLGLIVMDEEHENSYKSEQTPKYHAREVAREIARHAGAAFVLGSATPSMESYYRAKNGEYTLFELTERLTGGSLPQVYTVDLRKELAEGNRSIFSRKLQELLQQRLERGEQAILFLNRRGYAGFVSCRACGKEMKCPHCDVTLSEHYGGKLQCHYCGYETMKPGACPKCGSKYLMGFKAGTEKIELKLKEMFPGVTTLRMDADTTKTKESYEKILSSFANEEAQVLIGTQMIVKGHDFPKVTLACVLAADLSLGAGDYRAGERTFQLLTQAVGRAGRGSLPGEAVIQTYQPDHYAVVHAAKQDYKSFYEEEILYRKLAGYPPASHLLAVQVFAPDEDLGMVLAMKLAEVVKSSLRVLGPTPAAISKVKDLYRFVIYIKAVSYEDLVQGKDLLEAYLFANPPKQAYVQFDFDPMNQI